MSVVLLLMAAQSAASAASPVPPVVPPPPPVIVASARPASPTAETGPTPLGNPGTWATTNDYPAEALREGVEGVVGFLLNIDAGGVPTGCEVTSSSGSLLLDSTTCALVQIRARFAPGRDARGKAQAGTYAGRVRWVIPKDAYANAYVDQEGRFLSSTMTFRFYIEEDGSTSDCVLTIDDVSETLAKPEGPCMPAVPYKPFLDAKGMPTRKRVSVTLKTTVEDPSKP